MSREPQSEFALRVSEVSKAFGGAPVLDRVSLDVPRGSCVALLGPSGCGKTTLLRIVAGLERTDRGRVEIDGRVTDHPAPVVPPEKRRVGLVFQDQALWPHMDVAGNLGLVLAARGVTGADAERSTRRFAAAAGLPEALLGRRPGELSGGERQRSAVARALAQEPALVLLDEPLTGLDRDLRVRLLATLRALRAETGASTLLVTHDQGEAFALADRVVVLREGRIVQTGTPEEVYSRPASRFVAEFVGVATCLPADRRDGRIETALGAWAADDAPDGPLLAVVRPEAVRLDPAATARGTVADIYYQGGGWMHAIDLEHGGTILVSAARAGSRGDPVGLVAERPAFVRATEAEDGR